MHAQELITKVWEHTTGAPDTVDWSAQVQDATGNIYITGNTISGAELANVLTTVYDRFGDVKWQAEYNSSYDDNDYGTAIAIDDDLNVYVAAASYTSATNYYDYLVIKYDSTGSELWTATYNGPGSLYDIPSDILIDGSGNVYVTGGSVGSSTGWDYATVKYNSSGTQQWVSRYNYNDHDDAASGLATNSSGQILVTGASAQADDNWDFASVKYNQSTGAQITAQRNTASGLGIDRVNSIAIDADDNVYLTGRAAITSEGYNIRTIKLDSLLATIWNKQYNLADLDDEGMSVWVDGEGNVYVTGTATADNDKTRGVTIKYNSAGTLQWTVLETPNNGEALNSSNRAMSISEDGQIMVAGTAENGADTDIMTYVYDEDGNRLWAERWDGGDDDQASFIHADGDNEIFTGGISQDGGSSTYTLIKYRRAAYITPPDDDPDKPAYAGWWENRGQIIDTDDNIRTDIKYYADRHYPALYATDDSLFMVFSRIDTSTTTDDTLARIDMGFVGSSSTKEIMKTTSQGGEYRNFFLAHTGADGVTNVQKTDRLYTKDLYPKVDLMHYFDQAGVKFYLIIQPGYSQQNDPIEMVFNGADITFNADTTLTLETEIGGITLRKPEAYEIETDGSRTDLTWHPEYTDEGSGVVGMSLGSYTTSKVLVLEFGVEKELLEEGGGDDNVVWSTIVGGSGYERLYDLVSTNNVDYAVTDFLYTVGVAYDTEFPESLLFINTSVGDFDIFVQQFQIDDEPLGKPMWGLYLGGSNEDGHELYYALSKTTYPKIARSPWVHGEESLLGAYIVGTTWSEDFPTVDFNSASTEDYFVDEFPEGILMAGFITRVDAAGLPIWSTYIAGEGTYTWTTNVETSSDLVYICGASDGEGDFVLYDPDGAGPAYSESDGTAYIAAFSHNAILQWGTMIGGNTYAPIGEYGTAIAVSNEGEIYLSGNTVSGSFPTTTGAFQETFGGGGTSVYDAFLVKFEDDFSLEWATYLGGENQDYSTGIATDDDGDVFLVGYTNDVSEDLPVQTTYPSGSDYYFDDSYNDTDEMDGLIAEFDTDGDIKLLTYFGGDNRDLIYDISFSHQYKLMAFTGLSLSSYSSFPTRDLDGTYFLASKPGDISIFMGIIDQDNIWHYSSFVGGTADGWGMGVYCGWDYYFNTGYLAFFDESETFDPLVDTDVGDECWYQTEPLSFADPSTEGYPNYESYISVYNYEPFPEIVPTGLSTINSAGINIFPNPTTEWVNISTCTAFILDVFNSNGSMVFSCVSCKQVDVSNWPKGVYLANIVSDNEVSHFKIIVQ